jgi:hypothetical protein
LCMSGVVSVLLPTSLTRRNYLLVLRVCVMKCKLTERTLFQLAQPLSAGITVGTNCEFCCLLFGDVMYHRYVM